MRLTALMTFTMTATLVGCDSALEPGPMTTPPPPTVASGDEHGHDHAHPSEGPHHGVLVELGKEEFHAEVVHDDKEGIVTVYLLDSSAKKAATTDAAEVVINVKHGDKPEQFKLPAQPDMEDAAGTSSRFVLKDMELIEHLDEKDAAASLQVTIGGNPFTGKIPAGGHDHDHKH